MQILMIGDPVRKTAGDYHPSGIVVAKFETMAGATRIVVEHTCCGALHIYRPDQVEAIRTDIDGHADEH